VVCPCGWILDRASGTIRLSYGGDSCLALAAAHLPDLLGYLRTCPALPAHKRASMVVWE
jgi:hypothetical protein